MKWERYVDIYGRVTEDWIAQGEKGHFLLWKDGRAWRGLYMHEIGKVVKFRFWANTLREAKKMCEENYHWEGI